jgi:glyoxylase-like metal-dependent hydrolase (beta-lactamase superfamily II)
MIAEQHYLGCLSQASYLIADEVTGRAVVVDPQRDISAYLADAGRHGLTIERVIETHIHADFLSGHLELAERTGATIWYGEGAQTELPIDLLHDGERISLGDVELEVRATPGHTPESISLVIYEHPGDPVPYCVLTGDILFIGDVGRPDLLSGAGVSADQIARDLYRSLRCRLLPLPDSTNAFIDHPSLVTTSSRLTATELAERLTTVPDLIVVDVRNAGELERGVIAGTVHIPLATLTARRGELDPALPTVVHFASGYRWSSIATSVLVAHGFWHVSDLLGGYEAWALKQTVDQKLST